MSDRDLIQALRGAAVETGSLLCQGCGHEHNCGIHGCAIIRAAAERLEKLTAPEANTPLTLDELREMAQKCEGVYVAHIDESPVFRGQKYCAAVLDFSPAFGSTAMHVHAIYGDRLTMWEDDYGKTWLAYRHKPEEGSHAPSDPAVPNWAEHLQSRFLRTE